MPAAAFESMRRGLASLVANWELAFVLLLQSLATGILIVAGLVLPLLTLGIGGLALVASARDGWPALQELLAGGYERLPAALLPALAALVVALLVVLAAMLVYGYFQAGVVGLLLRAEAAAGATPGWRARRTFSWGGFHRLGARYAWRYFWFYHLAGLVGLGWLALAGGLAVAVYRLLGSRGGFAASALGCGGALPLALLLVLTVAWAALTTADLARPGVGVLAASLRALKTLGARFGPVTAVFGVAVVASLLLGVVLLPLGWGLDAATVDSLAAWLAGQGVVAVLQSLLNGALTVWVLAALLPLLPAAPQPR